MIICHEETMHCEFNADRLSYIIIDIEISREENHWNIILISLQGYSSMGLIGVTQNRVISVSFVQDLISFARGFIGTVRSLRVQMNQKGWWSPGKLRS